MDTKRFNNPDYKRQVVALRQHRRPAVRLPKNDWEKFLFGIGLDNIFKQILAVLAVIFLLYVIYFAPWFRITAVEVQGATSDTAVQQIQTQFSHFARQYAYGFPEKNTVFFQKERFSAYLLKNDLAVSKVSGIGRKSLHVLQITIVPRVPAFNLQTSAASYFLNSDGTVGEAETAVNPDLPILIDTAQDVLIPGQPLFSSARNDFLAYIAANFTPQTQLQIDHFELPGTASNDLIILTKNGARVMFDSTADPHTALTRLFTVWTSIAADQKDKLSYIDLRFDSKAFVCYQGTPCATQK